MQALHIKERQEAAKAFCHMILKENYKIIQYIFLDSKEMQLLSDVIKDFKANLDNNSCLKMMVLDLYEMLCPENSEFEEIKWDSLFIKEF